MIVVYGSGAAGIEILCRDGLPASGSYSTSTPRLSIGPWSMSISGWRGAIDTMKILKRLFDLTSSLALLILLSPLPAR